MQHQNLITALTDAYALALQGKSNISIDSFKEWVIYLDKDSYSRGKFDAKYRVDDRCIADSLDWSEE